MSYWNKGKNEKAEKSGRGRRRRKRNERCNEHFSRPPDRQKKLVDNNLQHKKQIFIYKHVQVVGENADVKHNYMFTYYIYKPDDTLVLMCRSLL